MPSITSVELAREYVGLLNGRDPHNVETVLAPQYTDHDAVLIPGVRYAELRRANGVQHMRLLIDFLSQPNVDLAFTVLDVFGTDDRSALRVFGEGTIHLPERLTDINSSGSSVETPPIGAGSRTQLGGIGLQTGKILGNSLHMAYSCTCIFGVRDGFILDRWGHVQIQ